jgi:hypothetical protein
MYLRFNTPILPYSNTPFCSCASEIFLSNLQKKIFALNTVRRNLGC